VGPEVTAFGVARADGLITEPFAMTGDGIPAYSRPLPNGFLLYVEFKRPPDFRPIATSTLSADVDELPDFQIVADRPLGNGSETVCDDGPAPDEMAGGVPAVANGDFESNPRAVNDFSCRFDVRTLSGTGPCTRNGFGADVFESSASVIQFCAIIGSEVALPEGDTRFTVRGRDTLGRPGPPRSILIRVDPQ
jgi:hypothetical protein